MKPFKVISFLFYRTWAWLAIQDAKFRKKCNRDRYWVVRLKNRIYVLNKERIRYNKKEGRMKKELNFIVLDKVAIYDTH